MRHLADDSSDISESRMARSPFISAVDEKYYSTSRENKWMYKYNDSQLFFVFAKFARAFVDCWGAYFEFRGEQQKTDQKKLSSGYIFWKKYVSELRR